MDNRDKIQSDIKMDELEKRIDNVHPQQVEIEMGKEKVDLNLDQRDDADLQVVEKFEVPVSLKKTFTCSVALLVIGITLFVLGFVEDVAAADPAKGITFWVLGGIVLIPGGYYSYQFYKAKKARSLDERDQILDDIPEL